MSVYFAHCMADYDGPREAAAMRGLRRHFVGEEVINPNSAPYQQAYEAVKTNEQGRAMDFWCDVVRRSDRLAFMLTTCGSLGTGVAKEVLEAIAFKLPIFNVDDAGNVWPVGNHLPWRILTIEQTRALIAASKPK